MNRTSWSFANARQKRRLPLTGNRPKEASAQVRSVKEGAATEARRLLAPLKSEIVELLRQLVATNSVAVPPQGNETAAQKALFRFFRNHRVDVEMYDTGFLERCRHPGIRHERHYAGRCNLIARLPGSGRGRSLLLTGHIDTVPPGRNPWKQSPWSAAVRKGRVYGLGSYDMKAGLAANCAVAVALKQAKRRLGGDLLCESVVDEEWGGGGGTLAGRLRGDTADACVIPEPTNLAIYRASRGGYVFDLIAQAGEAAAYFSKAEVISPAVPMGRLLGWVDSWRKKRRRAPKGEAYATFSDPAPVQVLAVEANRFDPDVPLSVPLRAGLRLYFQFLPHEDVPGVVRDVRRSLRDFCQRDPFFRAHPLEWRPLFDPPLLGHELQADHPWTRCLFVSAKSVLGVTPTLTAAEYPCDAFIFQRQFGIPTLIFGPRGAGAHNPDEYVEIPSVLKTAEVLLAATLEWCGS